MGSRLAFALCAALACATTIARADAPPAPLKIGMIMGFSGNGAQLARSVNASVAAYLAMHHDQIGGRPVQIIRRDDNHAPEVARRLAQELVVQDHVDVLFGGSSAPEAVTIGQVATQAKIPYFILNATVPGLLANAPYSVRTSFLTGDLAPALARWCVRNGIKNIYAIVADYSSGADTLASMTDAMAQVGGKVIGSVAVPLNTTDYSSYLLRVKDAKPDALFAFVGGGPASINLVCQFASSGLKNSMKLVGTADLISEELMAAQGDGAVGVVTVSNYSPDLGSTLNRAYVKAYRAALPDATPFDAPSFMSVQAYDALNALDRVVVAQHGSLDAAKTMELVRGMTLESPRGFITIDPATREIRESMYIRRVEVRNGQIRNVVIADFPPLR